MMLPLAIALSQPACERAGARVHALVSVLESHAWTLVFMVGGARVELATDDQI